MTIARTRTELMMHIDKGNLIKNGFEVICKILGGNMDLFSFKLYAPTFEQAMVMKKNFYDSPATIYKVMLALMTKDKESVGEALEELYGVL